MKYNEIKEIRNKKQTETLDGKAMQYNATQSNATQCNGTQLNVTNAI